mmetsp:Transcript_39622/g.118986  ORF Transcript_39622/g.118986 Transcript_39622/m.118986 type:complete len:136 (+) Transcript_39622:297-704(+)
MSAGRFELPLFSRDLLIGRDARKAWLGGRAESSYLTYLRAASARLDGLGCLDGTREVLNDAERGGGNGGSERRAPPCISHSSSPCVPLYAEKKEAQQHGRIGFNLSSNSPLSLSSALHPSLLGKSLHVSPPVLVI